MHALGRCNLNRFISAGPLSLRRIRPLARQVTGVRARSSRVWAAGRARPPVGALLSPAPGCTRTSSSPTPRVRTYSSHMHHVQTVTSEFLLADELPAGTHLHLIVLNYVLPQQTAQLWHRATTRICADGGANRLYDQVTAMLPGVDPHTARSSFLPDLIKGDLDSVRQDVQDFYTSRGVPMIDLSSDQETTDLEKCLLFLEGRLRAMSEQAATPAAPKAAGAQQHDPLRQPVVAAAAVSRMGHGARAIGALNAAQQQAPHSNGASTSSSSSFPEANTRVTVADNAAAAAAPAGSLLQPDGTARVGSNGSGPWVGLDPSSQPGANQQQQHHHHRHHSHTHHQHPHQQQQQQPVLGRIVMLDGLDGSRQEEPLLQQQEQPAEQSVSAQQQGIAPPGTPSSGSSSRVAHGLHAPPSSSYSGLGAGGTVQEVAAAVLSSSDAPVIQPAAKRLQQEHVILVLGALGGRLDHTLSNLNTLYCYRHLNMALWGDGNLVRLLRAGTARIRPARAEGPTCGLVPLARPATASSTGLKWDLDNTHMCFRGLLSTSNIISSDTITVSTDEDLLWITTVEDSTALGRA